LRAAQLEAIARDRTSGDGRRAWARDRIADPTHPRVTKGVESWDTLQIIFAGVLHAFLDAADVFPSDLPPHRVVLPVCVDFRFGLVQAPLPEGPAILEYYLQPHFVTLAQYETTQLASPPVKNPLGVANFALNGSLLSPAKIELLNATDDDSNELTRDDWFEDPRYSLATYVSNYELSQEVVLGGRAMVLTSIFRTGT